MRPCFVAPLVLALASCAADVPACPECATIDPSVQGEAAAGGDIPGFAPASAIPMSLADSGFYALPIHAFDPRWHLWSDGAEKERWIYIPDGTVIDTSKPDYWSFPIGTRVWKQFSLDGKRLETRYMAKFGPHDADWTFVSFAWTDDESTAIPALDGVVNARGTVHDIPPQSLCTGCHANVKSRVLGFGAIQLDYTAADDLVDLDKVSAMGWLSQPPPGTASPHYPIPGNAAERAALGYFHANCGHCHNSQSPLINRPMFRLETDHLATLAGTRTYQSTVNVVSNEPFGGASIIAKPRDPDHSIIFTRMKAADTKRRMPALGNEVIDTAGVTQIRSWITNL